jgi:hypothetical protein
MGWRPFLHKARLMLSAVEQRSLTAADNMRKDPGISAYHGGLSAPRMNATNIASHLQGKAESLSHD